MARMVPIRGGMEFPPVDMGLLEDCEEDVIALSRAPDSGVALPLGRRASAVINVTLRAFIESIPDLTREEVKKAITPGNVGEFMLAIAEGFGFVRGGSEGEAGSPPPI